MIKASIIPSVPSAFAFEGRRFDPSKNFFAHYSHFIRGPVLVGFEFPSADEAGEEFLSSRFVSESDNVRLERSEHLGHKFAQFEIWLGDKAGAESDQFLALGTWMFESSDRDYIIVIRCERQYWWSELGFNLAMEGPIPK